MPLHSLTAPASAVEAVTTALRSPAAVRSTRALRTRQTPLTLTHAHPVHLLDDLEDPAPASLDPRTVPLIGWRFLLCGADGTPVASAETSQTAEGATFSHFSEGPFVASTHLALTQAQALCLAFEPRLLSVPGLYMVALWLRSQAAADGSADVLVPLAPAPPGIAAHRPHRAADLLAALSSRIAAGSLLSNSA